MSHCYQSDINNCCTCGICQILFLQDQVHTENIIQMNPLHFLCLLTCIIILLFVLTISTIVYAKDAHRMEKEKEKENRNNTENTTNNGQFFTEQDGFYCKPGECVTNVTTGIKRCPVENEPDPYNPRTETCNSRFTCTSPRTRHPVGLNGETLQGTNCPHGVTCNCSNGPKCSLDRLTVFMVSDTHKDQRVIAVRNEGDLKLPVGYRLLCQLPSSLFHQGFQCVAYTFDQLYFCFEGKRGTDACSYGTAAVHMPRVGTLREELTVSCIDHGPCKRMEILYYDPKSRKKLCLHRGQMCTTI